MKNDEILKIKEKNNTKIKSSKKKVSKKNYNSPNNYYTKNQGKESGQTEIHIDKSSQRYGLPIKEASIQSNSYSHSIIDNQNSPSLTDMDIGIEPVNIICPFCKMKIRTEVEKKYNFLTFCCLCLLCCFLVIGLISDGCKCDSNCCSCCCCSCSCKRCYDGDHICPNCKKLVYSYNSCYSFICPKCPKFDI